MSQAGMAGSSGGGSGDVSGPGSSTNGDIAIFNGTTGKVISDSGVAFPIPVASGGTSRTSVTAYSVVTGGTTNTGALQVVSGLGTSGQVLTSNGAAALPSWQAVGGSSPIYFSSLLNGALSDVTGDGTVFTVICDQINSNSGSGYNNTTGIFTVPVGGAGFYQLSGNVTSTGFTSSHTVCQIFLAVSSLRYSLSEGNPFTTQATNNVYGITTSVGVYLNAGDTVSMNIAVYGGTKVVDVVGLFGGVNIYTNFSGARISI